MQQLNSRPTRLGEIDGTDNPQLAVAVGYDLMTRAPSIKGVTTDGKNRPGTELTIATVLPETEADELIRQLMEGP